MLLSSLASLNSTLYEFHLTTALELVGKQRRVLVGVLSQAFYTLGYFTAALLAYFITSWHWLQVAMTLPAILFLPYYW